MLTSGNDYLVTVKRNQGKLYEHLETFERYLKPLEEKTEVHQGRGRTEHRRVKVYAPSGLEEKGWEGVRTILCVERWGVREGKRYFQRTYSISSVLTCAHQWLRLVRGHWSIENQLHWPKDKLLGEDAYRIEDEQALLNWSVFRSIVINILRMNGFKSLKSALVKLANRVDVIFSLLK